MLKFRHNNSIVYAHVGRSGKGGMGRSALGMGFLHVLFGLLDVGFAGP